MRPWIGVVAVMACLYGAAGVALAAAAAHRGAGSLATIAADVLLFHGAAMVGFCTAASRTRRPAPLMVAASLVAGGTLLFSGHLAVHALLGIVPLPYAAPVGGSLTIVGWLVAAAALPLALLSASRPAEPIVSRELRPATPGSSTTG